MPDYDWTPKQKALIDQNPRSWARTAKLTAEQVKDIRRRTDSLTMPWTLEELAAEYDVEVAEISRIAQRLRWPERVHEPEKYWEDD